MSMSQKASNSVSDFLRSNRAAQTKGGADPFGTQVRAPETPAPGIAPGGADQPDPALFDRTVALLEEKGPLSAPEIVAELKLSVTMVMQVLSQLELYGFVRPVESGGVRKFAPAVK